METLQKTNKYKEELKKTGICQSPKRSKSSLTSNESKNKINDNLKGFKILIIFKFELDFKFFIFSKVGNNLICKMSPS